MISSGETGEGQKFQLILVKQKKTESMMNSEEEAKRLRFVKFM
jgi:hypothetical protein